MAELIYRLDNLESTAQQLNALLDGCNVIIFTGPLGAGKTTLIRALLQAHGVTEMITSPTFSYMNMYTGQHNKRFIHFDLYRLDTLDQFIAAGFDEYLQYPGATVLIEWPEIIESLLTNMPHCHLAIDYLDDKRKLMVEKHE